jgi:hypothetical protein
MAQENRSWGYDRIAGALKHPGYSISAQTVGNILKRHSIPPAPGAEEDDHLEGIHPHTYGRARRHGLFHR